jgi:hypothetical protein
MLPESNLAWLERKGGIRVMKQKRDPKVIEVKVDRKFRQFASSYSKLARR